MTVLNLARGKNGIRVPLHLPASGSEVKRAFEQLQEPAEKGVTRIDRVISPVPSLGNYPERGGAEPAALGGSGMQDRGDADA